MEVKVKEEVSHDSFVSETICVTVATFSSCQVENEGSSARQLRVGDDLCDFCPFLKL